MIRMLSSFIILVIASTALAFTDSQVDELSNLLARDLKPYVRTLSRDVSVYHYYHRSVKGYAPTDSKEFLQHYDGSIALYQYDDQTHVEVAGPGLYAAVDPASSREYGNAMLEITFKAGSRILVHPRNYMIALDAELVAKSEGWLAQNQLIGDLFSLNQIRPVTKRALEKLDVIAYTYGYSGRAQEGVCSEIAQEAFVIFGKRSSGLISIKGFTDTKPALSSVRERLEYRRIYELASWGKAIVSPWNVNYWRSHLFGCDHLYPEDQLP
jgi:hypothetical protein